jgi:hypothetical protein
VIAVLEQVAGRRQLTLNASRESSSDALHQPAEGLFGYLHEQVQMIGHPAIGVDTRTGMFERIGQDFIENLPVGVFEEDVLPMIAASRDVIDGSGHVQSW